MMRTRRTAPAVARRLIPAVVSAVAPAAALAVLAVLVAGPAQAAGYRYWSFWDRTDGTWQFATQGPSSARPADGDVQGFRFAVSADSQDASKPRGAADFDTICAGTPAVDGAKRVALVIDFGTLADASGGAKPPAERTACAQVSPDATSAEALAAVAKPLRYNSAALLCSIAGYPRTGCGEQVSATGADRTDSGNSNNGTEASGTSRPDGTSDADGGPSAGLIGGLAAVIALAGAGVWQARRRRLRG
ncbi:SCO2322 family protein [Streptomyces sp. NPDC051322]|uniref:SCO2322 family protein n=1 Tax=Streptomyces sp. NPDC051322 TaxID=3154645 RepID=UPI00344B2224